MKGNAVFQQQTPNQQPLKPMMKSIFVAAIALTAFAASPAQAQTHYGNGNGNHIRGDGNAINSNNNNRYTTNNRYQTDYNYYDQSQMHYNTTVNKGDVFNVNNGGNGRVNIHTRGSDVNVNN